MLPQRVLLVAVQGAAVNCSAEHVEQARHTRLLVVVKFAAWNWSAAHMLTAAQDRSDVAVGATDWYWLVVQLVRLPHVRSITWFIGGESSNCHAPHTV